MSDVEILYLVLGAALLAIILIAEAANATERAVKWLIGRFSRPCGLGSRRDAAGDNSTGDHNV